MTDCPSCGSGETLVVNSRKTAKGRLRRRSCGKCGARYSTIETLVVVPPKKVVTTSEPKARTMGERMLKRRQGILVPPELEADWRNIKLKGMSNFEAAKILKLPFPARKTSRK